MQPKSAGIASETNVNINIQTDIKVRDAMMLVNGEPARDQRFVKLSKDKLVEHPTNRVLINLGTNEIHKVLAVKWNDKHNPNEFCDVTISTTSGPKTFPLSDLEKALMLVEY